MSPWLFDTLDCLFACRWAYCVIIPNRRRC